MKGHEHDQVRPSTTKYKGKYDTVVDFAHTANAFIGCL